MEIIQDTDIESHELVGYREYNKMWFAVFRCTVKGGGVVYILIGEDGYKGTPWENAPSITQTRRPRNFPKNIWDKGTKDAA